MAKLKKRAHANRTQKTKREMSEEEYDNDSEQTQVFGGGQRRHKLDWTQPGPEGELKISPKSY